jgi:hypothetical protein
MPELKRWQHGLPASAVPFFIAQGTPIMKSERRHELEHNLLADWLADTLAKIKPYQNAILGTAILVVAVVMIVTVWRNMNQAQATVAWEEYFQALRTGKPAELEDVMGQYPDSQMAHWAAVAAGDMHLAAGCNLLFTDKPSGLLELREAVDLYLPILEQTSETALLERATFGLARAYEAQIDLDKAMERYKEVANRWPDGPFGEAASERLAALQRRSVRELADKFAKWEPKPAASDLPAFPTSPPQFDLDSLPDGPVFTPKTDFGLEGPADVPRSGESGDEPTDPNADSPLDEPES